MVSSWSLVASKPALYAGFGSLIDNPIERKVYYAKIIIKMYRTKGTLPANIPQFRQACPRMVTRQPTLLLTMLMITPSAPWRRRRDSGIPLQQPIATSGTAK